MNFLKKNLNGILVCFVIAVPSWLLGKTFPVVGGPVIAILAGMLITLVWTNKGKAESGIKWTSKIILQTAVVLLGFGMNLGVILQTSIPFRFFFKKFMFFPLSHFLLVHTGFQLEIITLVNDNKKLYNIIER